MPASKYPRRPQRRTDRQWWVQQRSLAQVDAERGRLVGSPRNDLRRTLIERFLARNLSGQKGPYLEIGPGPGRFTPLLLDRKVPVVLLDISRPMLRAARRSLHHRKDPRRPWGYIEAPAEDLPMLRDKSLGAITLVGLFGFFGYEGEGMIQSAYRALRPGGLLIVEAQAASHAIFAELSRDANQTLPILQEPKRHHFDRILEEGFQPLDPDHAANWDFRFWRPPELMNALHRAGFTIEEAMSVAPTLGNQDAALQTYRGDRRAWKNLIETEEMLGHRPECLGGGSVYLIAARRKRAR